MGKHDDLNPSPDDPDSPVGDAVVDRSLPPPPLPQLSTVRDRAEGQWPQRQRNGRTSPDRCECKLDYRRHRAPRSIIVLVHGTFSSHAAWLQHDSALARRLTEEGTAVQAFCWTGRNRHRDRIEAGASLRQLLIELRERYPSAQCSVVAHSHGGNVALYALREEGDADDAALAGIHVATLSTPFLTLTPRPLRRWRLLRHFAGLSLIVMPLLVVLSLELAFQIVDSDSFRAEDTPSRVFWALVAVVSAVAILRPISAILYARRRDAPSWRSLLSDPGNKEEARLVSTRPQAIGELLVLRSHGDEASGLLVTAQFLIWLGSRVRGLYRLKIVVPTALVSWAVAGITYDPSSPHDYSVIELMAIIGLAAAVLGGWVVGVIIHSPAMLFGFDGLFWILDAELTAEQSPPGAFVVHQVPSTADGRLRHSLYDNPSAIDAVLRWAKSSKS